LIKRRGRGGSGASGCQQGTVIVAVTAVRVMQMIADPVVGVIAMRHGLVAATGPVDMSGIVTAAAMTGSAALRILGRHLDHMLVDVTLVRMMEMPLVQIIGMSMVTHGRMAAAGTMLMGMPGMLLGGAGVH
jgi:hypothetical protein